MATRKADKTARFLTAEDIFSGGDDPFVEVEIPELTKKGKPGIVYLRQLPAGDVLDFVAQSDEDKNEALLGLLAKAVVTADGSPLFTEEQARNLRSISIGVFNRLTREITAMASLGPEGAEGNAPN
jgi:hypothetical protein